MLTSTRGPGWARRGSQDFLANSTIDVDTATWRIGKFGPSYSKPIFVELPSADAPQARADVEAIMQESLLEFSLSEEDGCVVIRRGIPDYNQPITRLAPDNSSYGWWKDVLEKIRPEHTHFWKGRGHCVKYEACLQASAR